MWCGSPAAREGPRNHWQQAVAGTHSASTKPACQTTSPTLGKALSYSPLALLGPLLSPGWVMACRHQAQATHTVDVVGNAVASY